MQLLNEFVEYHCKSSAFHDIDPANDCLRYICDRFELNLEQRYWLAFLYASTYSATTAYYIYNEFPDYENVDVKRMMRWWKENKHKTIFQTDRRWIKSRDQFVQSFVSYREFIGEGMTQHSRFLLLQGQDKFKTYDNCMIECSKIFTFGRFTLFIYLEMLNTIAGYDISPTGLDLKNAESSRNGLASAFGKEELMNHFSGKKLTSAQIKELESDFNKLIKIINDSNAKHNSI